MNTKQIQDVRLGNGEVDSLYLGNKLVWQRSKGMDQWEMPDKDALIAFYTLDSFSLSGSPDENGTYTGTWQDMVTGNKVTLPDTLLSDCGFTVNPAVRVKSGSVSFPVSRTENPDVTYYIRMRMGKMGVGTSYAVDFTSDATHGVKLYYNCPNLQCYSYGGYATPTVLPYNLYSHDFHTCAISSTSNGGYYIYCDGERKGLKASKVFFGDQITFTGNSVTEPVIETIAVYNSAHDAAKIAEISEYINNMYPFSLKPEEQRTYLYYYGDQKEALTGGWMGYSKVEGGFRYESDHFYLNGTSMLDRSACQTKEFVDFTPYKKLCYRVTSPVRVRQLGEDLTGAYYGYKENVGMPIDISTGHFAEFSAGSAGGRVGTDEAAEGMTVYVDISDVSGSMVPILYDLSNHTDGTGVYAVWLE